ncbi:putative ArsR family transcriptional regulator [Actinocrispum wychmicini]|uniref:Putative ArsR family transcriptional regulator n=1 Tax=Actinocrispum wychmicini TaxID=1213861 RepID=A0A4V2S4H6_9PSEU|nr:putative ArsR family transcriptional regulator [Actinocrispum wychmicini]
MVPWRTDFAKRRLCKVPPPDHPIRGELLDLLRERDTVTATEAARQLGHSSGLCSFHLRQLARYGYVEEVDTSDGRVRPWRLTRAPEGPDLGLLARELEDEGYRRWLQQKHTAPEEWAADEAFSSVLYLDPKELSEVGAQIRALLAKYATREPTPTARPVAAVARLFPLLPVEERTSWPSES